MRTDALSPYERSLEQHTPLWMWDDDGRATALDIERWRAPADDTDLGVVRRARSPVLDVGCGPGRIVAAMTEHGHLALGIDVSRQAVSMTRARGLNVVRRDVFDPLPGERRWRTIVVLDGIIGIGGDLRALLQPAAAPARPATASSSSRPIPTMRRCESVSVRLGTSGVPPGRRSRGPRSVRTRCTNSRRMRPRRRRDVDGRRPDLRRARARRVLGYGQRARPPTALPRSSRSNEPPRSGGRTSPARCARPR